MRSSFGSAERSRGRSAGGSATVEFALVLPVLLLVCLALVQIGIVVRDQLLVVQAARAGARQAALEADDDAVRSAALAAAAGLREPMLAVAVERAGGLGDPVRVTIGYTDPLQLPLAGILLPPTVVLRAQAVMRQEFG